MNKKSIIITVVLVVIIIFSYTKYNGMVVKSEDAKTAWSNVESEYQRRSDLIKNLVNTVKGAADFEKSTLEAVINARAKATSTQINVDDLTPENMAKFQQAQDGLSGALSRLLVTVERYPDLKANQNFLKLQDELASTENSVRTSRNRFNTAVNNFNKTIKLFPNNVFAGLFGFDDMARFKSAPGSEDAPDVEFDFNK
ncbi:LemA family protein [Kordia sp. SMS9]|uniref:LemA family protein n=1 Tax=Kordia sp. SMS9 TaxID=2282170 RepID=UPI000E0DA42A|nr:LemA family protein [Kordia sp. SMS9]AXG68102.1 LemA family protein [Kordia sp. SMS9]